jgi:hypothetical protein
VTDSAPRRDRRHRLTAPQQWMGEHARPLIAVAACLLLVMVVMTTPTIPTGGSPRSVLVTSLAAFGYLGCCSRCVVSGAS